MIAVKIQCGCGQKYAFDVQPADGLMPYAVACPVCGIDGTAAANQIIASTLLAQPAPPIKPQSIQPTPRGTPPATRGKDGWATEETPLNKIGSYITIGPAILAAIIPWTIADLQISPLMLFVIVGLGGLIGGILNLWGRGPIVAGMFIGPLIALGGYGAVCWWIHDRTSVRKYELMIAFAIGVAPGFIAQWAAQQFLRKRST